MKKMITLLVILVCFQQTIAADLLVPSQYGTIQEAIDAASSGDTVIVAPGTYFENIDFLGKAITVTSNFHITQNPIDITNTIINGSKPSDPDFASCVSFVSNETDDAILKGFTITGGTGTKTYNAVEDLFFRTGGGILINQSSPTIIYNIIRDNQAVAETGVAGAGGGGIRMGFGVPKIENNVIQDNLGGYAGGIMIAYCEGAILKNNLIASNTATGSFNGGGGVYIDWEPITLENNTIVNNYSGDRGGGIISTGTSTIIKNCIIYGNEAENGFDQIYKRFQGDAETTYCNIEDGFNGVGSETGNIDEEPEFSDTNNYFLAPSSPCIDAGNPNTQFNDPEDLDNPGNALFPAMGTLTNDMGLYGGSGARALLLVPENNTYNQFKITAPNPYNNEGVTITSSRAMLLTIHHYSITGQSTEIVKNTPISSGKNLVKVTIPSTGILVAKADNGTKAILKIIQQ